MAIDYEVFPNEVKKYDRILITKDAVRIYEGVILDIDFPEFMTGNEKIHITLTVSDNSEIANRVTINDVFENTDTSALVTELVTDYLLPENCTIGSININVFAITRIVYGDRQLDKVLDELAEISGAYWYIDKNRVFYMRTFNITNPSVIPEIGDTWGEHISNFKPKFDGSNYRNRQILNGGFAITDQLTQSFKGDGENQTFTLDFLIKEIVSITVNGLPATISERSENLDTDFYYTFKQKQITQDFGDSALLSTDTLEIEYIGFFRIRSVQEDLVEIAARAVITFSTGLVSYAATDPTIEDINTAVLRTIALLEKYLEANASVTFKIVENLDYDIWTLDQGQTFTINNTKLKIDDTFLITNIDFHIVSEDHSFVTITAVDLTSVNSVVNQFLQINRDAAKIEIREDEIIIQTINVEEVIEVTEEIEIIKATALITGQPLAITGRQNTAILSLAK